MDKGLPEVGNGNGVRRSGEQAKRAFVEGISPSMRPVELVIQELAQTDVPVLLLAERGAGKTTTAQRIHQLSRRSAHPFRVVMCANLKPAQLDSSDPDSVLGCGTVFFRELAGLDAECQAQLVEALLHAERNGVTGDRARLIFGSAKDLEQEVKERRLREDLYYRISGVCLRLPPLRQRREDFPLLMDHFLREYARDFQRPVPELSAQTQQLFQDYSWPGNLLELEHAAKTIVALGDERLAMGGLRALLSKPDAKGNGAVSLKEAARAASREAEKELILRVLTRTRWNRRRAAQELQISYKALLYKLKQIGCEGYGTP
jgi:two-component system, NtrC family, response regulator AtoC